MAFPTKRKTNEEWLALDPSVLGQGNDMGMTPQAILLIVGLLLCLGGWVALWLGMRLVGAAFGLGLGFIFGNAFCFALGLGGGTRALVELGCAFLGAVGGIFFIRALTSFLVTVVGFLLGVMLARLGFEMLSSAAGHPYVLTPRVALVAVGGGALMAMVALWLRRQLVIVITAFVGTSFLCAALPLLDRLLPWSFVAVFIASLVVQGGLSRALQRRGRENSARG